MNNSEILKNAPEGATHYSPEVFLHYKFDGCDLYYYSEDMNQWYPSRKPSVRETLINLNSLRENWSEEDEKRMDVIGSNGPSGEHYDAIKKDLREYADKLDEKDGANHERYMVMHNGLVSDELNEIEAEKLAIKMASESPGKQVIMCKVVERFTGRVEVERVK